MIGIHTQTIRSRGALVMKLVTRWNRTAQPTPNHPVRLVHAPLAGFPVAGTVPVAILGATPQPAPGHFVNDVFRGVRADVVVEDEVFVFALNPSSTRAGNTGDFGDRSTSAAAKTRGIGRGQSFSLRSVDCRLSLVQSRTLSTIRVRAAMASVIRAQVIERGSWFRFVAPFAAFLSTNRRHTTLLVPNSIP